MQAACLHNQCNRQDVRAASRNSLTSTTTQPYPAASGERRPKVFRQSRSLDLLSLIAERDHHLSHNEHVCGCASRLPSQSMQPSRRKRNIKNVKNRKNLTTRQAPSGERRPKVFRQSRSLDLLSLIAERVHHLSHNEQVCGCASRLPSHSMQPPRRTRSIQELTNVHNHTTLPGCIR